MTAARMSAHLARGSILNSHRLLARLPEVLRPVAIAVALVFGTFVNPLLFVPLAFDPQVERRLWYRALALVSFVGVSGGLLAAAVVGPG